MPQKCELLLQKILGYYPEHEHQGLIEVYQYSRHAHEGQFRQTGEIFLHHPLEVALILAQLGFDLDTVKAAILHDILEDCHVSYEELERTFGSSLAKIVNGVTKITALDNEIVGSQNAKEQYKYDSFLKFIFAISEDIRVVLVKLADRLHNLRTLMGIREGKRKKIAAETLDIYVPLANRLGLTRMKNEMEDLCLKYLEPKAYYKIKNLLEEKREQRELKIQEAKTFMLKKIAPYKVPVRIEGRPKHFYSIFRKMSRQHLSFDEIFDLLGLRLITDTKEHCYLLLGIIHDIWQPGGSRFKDYIASPKPNNYQSLHTTVVDSQGNLIEIQIRTDEMDRIADKGIAAHWCYKEESQVSMKDQSFYNFLMELIESTHQEKNARDSYNNIKNNLLVNTIFVRTPRGKVIELPRGSTPVDFAYAIHTEVGNTCVGARVNGRLVPLNHKLKTEDVVWITTNKQSHPSPDWLEFVATSRARNKIRHWIKQTRIDLYLAEGRNRLQKGIKSFSLNVSLSQFFNQYLTSANLQKLHYQDIESLLVDLGQNQLKVTTLFSRLEILPSETAVKPVFDKKSQETDAVDEKLTSLIQGVDNIHTQFAKCCKPLPDCSIQGVITSAKKVTIHRKNCANIRRVAAHKKIPIYWQCADNICSTKQDGRLSGVLLDEVTCEVFEKMSSLTFYMAKCCKPSNEDDLKGFYSNIRRGISVHKKDCFYIIRRFQNKGCIFQVFHQCIPGAKIKMRIELPNDLLSKLFKKLSGYSLVLYSLSKTTERKIVHIELEFSFLSLNNSRINDTINSIKSEIMGLHGQSKIHVQIKYLPAFNSAV